MRNPCYSSCLGLPHWLEKKTTRRETEQVILEKADPARTKCFAETSIAKRDSVWSFELVWQGNGLNQSQKRSTWDWVVPTPCHILLPYAGIVGLTAVLRETWCDLWLPNLHNIDSWWRNIILYKELHFLLPTPTFCFKQDLFQERGQLGTKIYQTASQPVPLSPARNSWNEAMQLFLFVRPWPIFSRLLYKTNPLPHFSLPLFKGKKQTDLPKLRQNTVHSQVGWKKDAAKLASTAPCPAFFPEFQQQQQKCWTTPPQPPAPRVHERKNSDASVWIELGLWKASKRCCHEALELFRSSRSKIWQHFLKIKAQAKNFKSDRRKLKWPKTGQSTYTHKRVLGQAQLLKDCQHS